MHSKINRSMRTSLLVLSNMCIALLLTACGNSEDADKLKAALEINTLNITSLEVTSPKNIMEVTGTEPFTAMAIIANGDEDPVDITNKVDWSSSDNSSASINSSGVLTASATESVTVTVTARLADLSASKDIRLSNAALVSIDIIDNPSPVSVCQDGFQINANGNYEDEVDSRPITNDVTWTSASPDILTVDETGAISTFKDGTAVVTASKDAIESTASIIVSDDLATIVVTADSDAVTVNVGETLSFTATGRYLDNSTANITNNVLWASDTPDALTISNDAATKGVATGVSEDDANISASCESASAEPSNDYFVTVEPAPVINGVSINEGKTTLRFVLADSPEQLTLNFSKDDGSLSTDITDDDNTTWSVDSTVSGAPVSISDIKGDKGEITFTEVGITRIRAVYNDSDSDLGILENTILVEVTAN